MLHTTPIALTAPDSRPSGLVEDLRAKVGVALRCWPIVAIAVLSCLTIAVVYLASKTTVYQASSRLLVLQQGRSPLNLTTGDAGRLVEGVEDSLPTQAMILRSPLVVDRALKAVGRGDVSVQQAIGRLTVSRPDPVARILQVGYVSGDPKSAVEVIQAVLDSYEHFLDDHSHKKSSDVVELLRKARDELSTELEGLDQRFMELLQEAPAHAAGDSGRASQARRIEQWDRAVGETQLKAVQLRAQLQLGRKLADEGADQWVIVQAMGRLGGDPANGTIPQDADDPLMALRTRVLEELGELEIKRVAAGHLIDGLSRATATADPDRPVNETALARLFYTDPDVSELRDQLRIAKQRKAGARRMARSPGDPAVRNSDERAAELQSELNLRWAQQKPALLEKLGHDMKGEAGIDEAQAELAMVSARERSLNDKLGRLDAEILRRLGRREGEQSERLGPQHPQVLAVRAQIARVRDGDPRVTTVPEQGAIHTLLGALEQSLISVESMREEIQRKFADDLGVSKQAEIDRLALDNVRSNVERQRSLFNSVVDQLKQVQLEGEFYGITAQVLEPPSASPVRPNMILILAVALMAGLTLGIGAASVADQLDSRLRSVEEIRQAFTFPILGLMPQLSSNLVKNTGSIGMLGHAMPRSSLAECFRVVRTNLDLRHRSRPLQVILVTSPLPGDGKSMTASNLAISLAQAGRRVLLVDADLRRPTAHVIHGLTRDQGLADVLRDEIPIHVAIQVTSVRNLDLVPAGVDVPDPAELLTSSRLGEFIAAARQSYEAVVIDSPPLLSVADSAILGGAVDGILVVVRSSRLRRQDAGRMSEILQTIGTTVLGAVVNGTDAHMSGYGYGYGYGSKELPTLPTDGPKRGRGGATAWAASVPLVNGQLTPRP